MLGKETPRSVGGVGMSNSNSNTNSNSNSNSSSSESDYSYSGWVYHLGVNKIGHEFCHLRYLFIRAKYVELYKRDPHHHPHIKPIRRGVVSYGLMLQDLGRRRLNHGDLYVLRFYNRLDESKKGQIACATAGEVNKWIQAFEHAKHQVQLQLSTGPKLNMEDEIDLDGHRHTVRRYAHGLRKLIKIGQGPEPLLRQSSALPDNVRRDGHLEADADAIEAHTWKCVHTMSGIRIFEDVAESKVDKSVLVKSVGMIDASADVVFEVLFSLERSKRYEWDMLTGDLELIESIDGHYDVVYGTYDPKYFSWWSSKRDFVFSRQWFCGQDGTYTILQLPAVHKKRPPKSGYRRTKINPSSWEIKSLVSTATESPRCLLTHMLEMKYDTWCKWKQNRSSQFDKSVPFALLCQVAGIKEYVGANPALAYHSATTVIESKSSDVSVSSSELDDAVPDEFYDAIAAESSEGEDSDDEVEIVKKNHVKLKNVAWAIAGLSLKRTSSSDRELVSTISPVPIDPNQFHSTLLEGKDENEKNCWRNPGGMGFMIRGKTYLKDYAKVRGGDPLLKLVGVDWLKSDHCIDKVALRPSCIIQSEAGRKLPFILVLNLQIPAKPNYNMVFYFAADRPVSKDSLLSKFIDGSDMFRDSRFKLIPSIVEGYWMVKRAVGSKACLLGKAVTCSYLRRDNFLEIDVDIGSSSVARSVIGLVLGYVTGLVVDLAVVIEAQEEDELPEYLLGTVRLNCVRLDSAVEP